VARSRQKVALTVDCVVFGLDADNLRVLLIQRSEAPYAERWALPGSSVASDQTLEDAAIEALAAETNVRIEYLEQLYTFGDIERDPRGRTITVAYYGLVKPGRYHLRGASGASKAEWFAVDAMPALAFDHDRIVAEAFERLRSKVRYQPIGFDLLPKKFSLRQLQRLYELALGRDVDKRNFRKKILGMGLLVELDEKETGVSHRAARLYRFDRRKYRRLEREGFDFQV